MDRIHVFAIIKQHVRAEEKLRWKEYCKHCGIVEKRKLGQAQDYTRFWKGKIEAVAKQDPVVEL